jgi:LEA14-like dessication related protein
MNFRVYLSATAFILLTSCASVKPITVAGIDNLQVEDILLHPKISFNVNLHNPNNFGLTLKEFKTSAYLNDKIMTDLYTETKIRIARNSNIAIPLKTEPSIKELMTTYLSGALKGKLKVEGYFTVKKFLFRRKFPFSFTTEL